MNSPPHSAERVLEIQGRGCGVGRVQGTLVRKDSKDDIIARRFDDEIWLLFRPLDADVVLAAAGVAVTGLLATVGGCTAHGATIARELGLPLVIVLNASLITPNFTRVELDASTGRIILRE